MNKLGLLLIFVLALITSACAGNAQAMEVSKPIADDRAAEVFVSGSKNSGSYSGDDVYDPAAGTRFKSILKRLFFNKNGDSYSGDDVYDPAAGAKFEGFLTQHFLNKSGGNYSGDDAYDPATGAK